MGTPNPMTRAPMRDEGVIHAGSWRDPCRERVRASNLKGARLRLLDDPIGHDGHRRPGQGVAPTLPRGRRTSRRAPLKKDRAAFRGIDRDLRQTMGWLARIVAAIAW